MRCQLCGYEFDEKQMSCHASCAFNKHCAIICCPNCGYQVADESKSWLVAGLRRLFGRQNAPPGAITCPLSMLRVGQTGKVVSVQSANVARANRLAIFGLAPGAQITLEQRHPEFVLRVGFTELSIERDVAAEIMVEVG